MRGRYTSRLVLALAVIGGAAACKRSGDKHENGPASPANRAAAAAAVSFLPKDTGFIVGASIKQLEASRLWDKYGAVVQQSRQKQLAELKTECGIDVAADLESILVAGDSSFDERTMVIALKGKWDEAKVDACFAKLVEKGEHKTLTVTKDGKLTKYSVEGGDDVYAYWMGSTVVVTPSMLQDKFRLAEVAVGATSVKDNGAMMATLDNVGGGATLWASLVIANNGGASKMLSAMEAGTPSSAWGALHFAKTLDLSIGLGFADEKQAKTTADKLTSKLGAAKADPTLGPFVSGAKVAASGNTATVTLALDAKQVDQLLALVDQQVGSMLPSLLGGD